MKLNELHEEPLLVELIRQRLNRGETVLFGAHKKIIKVETSSGIIYFHFGRIATTPGTVKFPKIYTIPYGKIDRWTIVKEGDGWRVKMDDLKEEVDSDDPLLVHLVNQRLEAGEKVNVSIVQGHGAVFNHVGEIKQMFVREAPNAWSGRYDGKVVQVDYIRKLTGAHKTIVLKTRTFDPTSEKPEADDVLYDFDDLFELRKIKQGEWLFTNVPLYDNEHP